MKQHLAQFLIQAFDQQKFYVVTPDVGYGMWQPIKDHLGPYALNVGITESHSVDFAAGLAQQYPVFLYSMAGMVLLKGLEQIKLSLAYDQAPVCLISAGGNFYYGPQGITHYASEDLALLANYPSITRYYPHTPVELAWAGQKFLGQPKPSYIRLDPHLVHLAPPKIIQHHNQTFFAYQYPAQPQAFILVAGTHTLAKLLQHPLAPTWAIFSCSEISPAYLAGLAQIFTQLSHSHQLPFIYFAETGPTNPEAAMLAKLLGPQVNFYSLNYGDSTSNYHIGSEEYVVAQNGLGREAIEELLQMALHAPQERVVENGLSH